MIIPGKYSPLFSRTQIELESTDGWVQIDLSSLPKNPAACYLTAIGGDNNESILFANYEGDGDPGNDKKPRLFNSVPVFIEGIQNIKNLWFRNYGATPASISIEFYTV